MAEKEEKYIVFKQDDLAELILSDCRARQEFGRIVERYEAYRSSKGKKRAEYIVCNQDEPYADEVWRIILEGEDAKNGVMPKKCNCDFRAKLNGDGCSVCNLDRAKDLERG